MSAHVWKPKFTYSPGFGSDAEVCQSCGAELVKRIRGTLDARRSADPERTLVLDPRRLGAQDTVRCPDTCEETSALFVHYD